ncbi:MAG: M28 family peptidase [Bradymonadaceae bacterium]|nr:M28 family peptidase [Lujinxingiaceae bacterium]
MSMPGESFAGPLPELTAEQIALREELRADVYMLAGEIGPRNVAHPKGLAKAVAYLEGELEAAGFAPARQGFQAAGLECVNLEVEVPGTTRCDEIVLIGAHYDSVEKCPAANDNASGVAGVLALARRLVHTAPARTLRFVLFVNEEPPHFQTRYMGSWVYAKRCRERDENIVAMLSLETIGYFDDSPASQHYPVPGLDRFFPSVGDFIAFVGNLKSRKLVHEAIGAFRELAAFPSQGVALPGVVTGVGWSDHWAFWQEDYPALMVTDTAPFRYPHYHTLEDTPDKLDYDRFARVVDGMGSVIGRLTKTL